MLQEKTCGIDKNASVGFQASVCILWNAYYWIHLLRCAAGTWRLAENTLLFIIWSDIGFWQNMHRAWYLEGIFCAVQKSTVAFQYVTSTVRHLYTGRRNCLPLGTAHAVQGINIKVVFVKLLPIFCWPKSCLTQLSSDKSETLSGTKS